MEVRRGDPEAVHPTPLLETSHHGEQGEYVAMQVALEQNAGAGRQLKLAGERLEGRLAAGEPVVGEVGEGRGGTGNQPGLGRALHGLHGPGEEPVQLDAERSERRQRKAFPRR